MPCDARARLRRIDRRRRRAPSRRCAAPWRSTFAAFPAALTALRDPRKPFSASIASSCSISSYASPLVTERNPARDQPRSVVAQRGEDLLAVDSDRRVGPAPGYVHHHDRTRAELLETLDPLDVLIGI